MPPLLADFIQPRVCNPICAKSLTGPQQSHPISALSVALRVAAIPNVATTAARNSQPIDWKFTRHSAHGQEGPLGGVSVNSPKTDNIHHFPPE